MSQTKPDVYLDVSTVLSSNIYEPNQVVEHTNVSISIIEENDDRGYGEYVKIGEMSYQHLDLDKAAEHGFNVLLDVLDSASQALYNMGSVILDEDGEIDDSIDEVLEGARFATQITFLDTLRIDSSHRNKGYGRTTIQTLLDTVLSRSELIVLQASPLNPREDGLTRSDIKYVTEKLIKFYSSIGFELIPETDGYMVYIRGDRL